MIVMARLHALRNDQNLARFVIDGESYGRHLGTGSYGSVEEIITNGLVCAGKKIHEDLLDPGNERVRDIAERHVQECQLMSDLHHPNITLFLGVCFLPNCQLPVLLMERLDGSLHDLLETVPNIPLALKRSILEDVSRGLLYLHKHTPQIIHRDLTAKNVLLTSSLVAKITDFGNARIVNLQPGQLAHTLSRLPGTLAYMPPEALSASARYGSSLDVFSFGHLALFTLNQVFPGDLLEHNYPDPENPDRLTGRTEVERRGRYFESLEQTVLRQHQPLIQLTKDCLHNTPSRRPSTEQVLQALEEMKATIEGPYGEFSMLDAVRQVAIMRALRGRDEDVRVKTDELAVKEGEIQQLQQQLEQAQVQIQHKNTEIDQLSTELQRRDEQLQQKDEEIQQLNVQIQHKNTEIDQLSTELQRRDEQLQQKDEEIQQLNLTHQYLLEEKDMCICQQQGRIEILQAVLRMAQTPIQHPLSEGRRVDLDSPQPQAQFAELEVPLNLQWKRGRNMNIGMSFYPQAVVLKGRVYVGGGNVLIRGQSTIVTCYDIEHNQWTALTRYHSRYYAMTAVNEELVLIGGQNPTTAQTTRTIGVWDEGTQRWVYHLRNFPPLPTACDASTAVVHDKKWLIVAGGRDDAYLILSKVYILDLHCHQWYSGAPLPQPAHKMTAAVIGSTLVLLGGAGADNEFLNKVFSVQLDNLISQAISHESVLASPWQNLPDIPVVSSTALAFNGALLAVGGNKPEDLNATQIHLFKPSSGTWVEAGHLLVGRLRCACKVLPSGEIFIAGSSGVNSKRVHIAALR